MTLKLIEGFDHFSSAALAALKSWTIADAGGVGTTTFTFGPTQAGRVNGYAVKISYDLNASSAATFQKSLPSSYTSLVEGFAFQLNGLPNLGQTFTLATLQAGVTQTCRVILNANGTISIKNSGGTTVATGTFVCTASTWIFVEVKLLVNGASGSVATQVNGAADIAATTGNFGSTAIDTVKFCPDNKSNTTVSQITTAIIDDIYVLDTSAPPHDDFLGDVHVETIYPISDGANTAWTPNSGTNHFDRVNEHTAAPFPDGDTTYVSSATLNAKDSYGYSSLALLAGTVFAVQTNLFARKDDAAVRQLQALVRSSVDSANHLSGSNFTLSTTYVDGTFIWETDPGDGGAWTIARVNAAEFGVDIST